MVAKLKARTISSIADNFFIELIPLTNAEALAREVTLTHTPAAPDKVSLDLIGGTSQVRGRDFQVVGNKITWDGLALETLLDEDDELRAIYAT